MNTSSVIYVSGASGLVGSAIVRLLKHKGYTNVITERIELKTDQTYFFFNNRIEYVFHCAAKVGGMFANINQPYEFITDNLRIQQNVISAARICNVKKLIFFSSAAVYPQYSASPIHESALLSGHLDQTKEYYAIAKIAGMKMCEAVKKEGTQDFIGVVPNNIYGINDNFNPHTSHVIPGILYKIHQAKIKQQPYVDMLGTGLERREFIYVDDVAEAAIFLMEHEKLPVYYVNIGSQRNVQINQLASLIAEVVGYKGELRWQKTGQGTQQRFLDSSYLQSLGWTATKTLEYGIEKVYDYFLATRQYERYLPTTLVTQ